MRYDVIGPFGIVASHNWLSKACEDALELSAAGNRFVVCDNFRNIVPYIAENGCGEQTDYYPTITHFVAGTAKSMEG